MKYKLITLGCPKNIVDSERIVGALGSGGARQVEDAAEADAIVINTCGFIDGAKEESIETILSAVALKNGKPGMKVLVTGCLAERYREALNREIPEVDAFYGNRDLEATLHALARDLELKHWHLGERELQTPAHYAYLKVSEGCENPCTFCAIPLIRGPFRSKAEDTVVREARNLAARGVRELIVVGQDTTMYGQDLYGEVRLASLLRRIARVVGIHWVRLLYTFPAHITDDVVEVIAAEPNICKYVDIPIQHVNGRVLKRMARKHDRAHLEMVISDLRKGVPEIALRTSVIVGFPGETEAEFDELCQFVQDQRFDRLGIFTYSREEDTPAADFDDQVPDEVKRERSALLEDIQQEILEERNHGLVGQDLEVLIDKADDGPGGLIGRTQWDCPEIDPVVRVEGRGETGVFRNILITGCANGDLSGVTPSS